MTEACEGGKMIGCVGLWGGVEVPMTMIGV